MLEGFRRIRASRPRDLYSCGCCRFRDSLVSLSEISEQSLVAEMGQPAARKDSLSAMPRF